MQRWPLRDAKPHIAQYAQPERIEVRYFRLFGKMKRLVTMLLQPIPHIFAVAFLIIAETQKVHIALCHVVFYCLHITITVYLITFQETL